ncbi:helix-turn-helix transcriptional regulator [Sphingopyxis sp.]|uniref:helix-turn-helix transcriptional regulator n=1 Tax=Sphingopyxis sp. TaxID=1908224 RepID=UPI0035B22805
MREMPHWKGRLVIEACYARWSGSVGDAAPHRHFAAQAILSTEPLAVVDASGARFDGHCLLIEPETVHRLLPAGGAELWFVEPTVGFGPPDELRTRMAGIDPVQIGPQGATSFWQRWFGKEAKGVTDPRIAGAVVAVDRLLAVGPVRLADAAHERGLSLDRFRHLFTAEVGMPFQRYVLWRRLLIAFEALHDGHNITEAAYAAGFSDSAHLARTIRAMFGIRASDLDFTA